MEMLEGAEGVNQIQGISWGYRRCHQRLGQMSKGWMGEATGVCFGVCVWSAI